jgi:hypothetical protein
VKALIRGRDTVLGTHTVAVEDGKITRIRVTFDPRAVTGG